MGRLKYILNGASPPGPMAIRPAKVAEPEVMIALLKKIATAEKAAITDDVLPDVDQFIVDGSISSDEIGLIDYALRIRGVPVRWRTEITE